jgi:transcriptional regulator with PAS, ATPase and Fis domain
MSNSPRPLDSATGRARDSDVRAPARAATDFRTLAQSPLRAALVRLLHGRPDASFEIETLMQTFGCLRQDIENCLEVLGEFGLVTASADSPAAVTARLPDGEIRRRQLEVFLARQATEISDDRSPAVRRFRELIGSDDKMPAVLEWARTAAKSDISVLVLGPTGSGKELVARMIHELSRRASRPAQTINCAALPDTLFESEIFGYEKGAFTGAAERKVGRLELADGGTLFLDEIGDLSVAAQAKLLRVLEERRFERLGGSQAVDVDFRLVSATNRPLEQLVREGQFREDLYYRVNAFAIRLPSLRERSADIPLLARRFLARHCDSRDMPADAMTVSPEAMERLAAYPWPGNIRELDSTIARAALSAQGRVIQATDLTFLRIAGSGERRAAAPLASLRDAERAHIARVLEAVDWNKKRAASILEISRGTLYRKIDEYDLHPVLPSPVPHGA